MSKNERLPRITSQFSFTIEAELKSICDNIDFRHPIFEGRGKRNRSLGSVVALIVELALTDEEISKLLIDRLKPMMINKGAFYTHSVWYKDKY